MNNEQQLKRIQDKLQQLLKQHAVLQKENGLLKEELQETKSSLTVFQKNTDDLKQQVSVLKSVAGEMNEADKKEFEKRLNAYIKEIDRCITLLGE
jgi:septal ring factor EnvC (AmiA/AmiB activator)